jgi:hypothetical protein
MKEPNGEILDYDMQKAIAESLETPKDKDDNEEKKAIDP